MAPISENQYLITLKGIDSYWETFSGFSATRPSTPYNDGLRNQSSFIIGFMALAEMSVSKAFDPVKDQPIIELVKNYCPEDEDADGTCTVTPVKYCPTITPYGASLILYNVKLLGLIDTFNVDRKSTNAARIGIRFIADDFTYR